MDIVDYNSLENAGLKAHVDQVGLEFYKDQEMLFDFQ
jgi:hypothetical protein